MKQQLLFKEVIQREFGGSLSFGKRKGRRPLSSKLPQHFILKASDPTVLLPAKTEIEAFINKISQKFGVRVIEIGVHVDHIHLIVLFPSREIYKMWVRGLTGVLARRYKFRWRLLPYTRSVTWGRELKSVRDYVEMNRREGKFILKAHDRVSAWRLKIGDEILKYEIKWPLPR